MKNTIILFAFMALALAAKAGNIDTATFEVVGICGMCEDRIENAAYIKGVKKVEWNKDKQELTVIYKPKKVTVKDVARSVAEAGHDNEYFTATEAQYDKVHNCCKYRELEVH